MLKKLQQGCALTLLLLHQITIASLLLHGDPQAAPQETFSFPISAHTSNSRTAQCYTGAHAVGANDFSLAKVSRLSDQFVPLAPASITINYKDAQKNPLFNERIKLLDLLIAVQGQNPIDRLVAVTQNSQYKSWLFLVDVEKSPPASMLVVPGLRDAEGLITSNIVNLEATESGRSGVFAAVNPHNGTGFGNTGSGIALVELADFDVQEGEKTSKKLIFRQMPAEPGSKYIKATPFDKSSLFLKIGANVVAMTDVVDIAWDATMQRLFVTIQGQAGPGVADGVRSIAVGRVTQSGKLLFEPIAPATLFTAGAETEIVGGVGPSTSASVHHFAPLHTTTGLDYAVLVGGNGTPAMTKRSVFAVPLVNTMNAYGVIADEKVQGTLAAYNETPRVWFSDTVPPLFKRRAFITPATKPSQALTMTSAQARVGRGSLAAGDIEQIVVVRDTVFACVQNADAGQLPGMFYSQALFDSEGRIFNWTSWQRVGGTTDAVFGMFYDSTFGDFTVITGSDPNNLRTVRRTVWSQGSEQGLKPLGTLLMQQFSQDQAGVQGLFDFQRLVTPGLVDSSLLIATGNKKIALIETGAVVGGTFVPNTGDFVNALQEMNQGKISSSVNAKVLVMSGGVLDTLGPIVCADIGVDTTTHNAWIFVGGDAGLAVLTDQQGNGWNATTGLQPSLTNLMPGMSFKKIGDYSFVRTLYADEHFLYVLTDKKLDRIDLAASDFGASPRIIKTTLATTANPSVFGGNGVLLDVIVSGKFALLATSNGLYRLGDKSDARSATVDSAYWTPVPVPEATGSVIQLYASSVTGRSQDVARFNGGNIYALNGFTGISQGQVNRYAVQDVSTTSIGPSTIMPIPDMIVENVLTGFRNFGGFANQWATDGALWLYSRCRVRNQAPFLRVAVQPVFVQSNVQIPLDNPASSTIVRIMRNSATGSWMVVGDCARFNE